MASITLNRGNTLPDSSAKADFHNLVDQATASITNIVNADVSNSAAISSSKIDLSAVGQKIIMNSKAVDFAQGSDVASATTTDIGAATGNFVDVTGTTTITGLGTVQAGSIRFVRFTGILTLTHNGTSLILPTTANITTAANDRAIFASLGSGNWICLAYQRADGTPLVSTLDFASQAEMESASSNTKAVTPGRTQYHPGVAKAWVVFTDTGTAAISSSHNVSSITDNGTGDYTINFTIAFSSEFYAWSGSAFKSSLNAQVKGSPTSAPSASSCRIQVTDGANSAIDPTYCSVIFFGDQS